MNQFESMLNQLMEQEPFPTPPQDQTGLTSPEEYEDSAPLTSILLRWKDGSVTAIRGPLLNKMMQFLKKVQDKIPLPIQGQLFPSGPDDQFVRGQGWVPSDRVSNTTIGPQED